MCNLYCCYVALYISLPVILANVASYRMVYLNCNFGVMISCHPLNVFVSDSGLHPLLSVDQAPSQGFLYLSTLTTEANTSNSKNLKLFCGKEDRENLNIGTDCDDAV